MLRQSMSRSLGLLLAFFRALPSVLWKKEAQFKGVQCAENVLFLGRPLLSLVPGSRIVLGRRVRIHSALRSNPLGCAQPSVLRTQSAKARIELGDGAGISAAVLCAADFIEIGEGTILGSGAMVVDNDFHSRGEGWSWKEDYLSSAKGIKIGRGVFIGARVLVLKGVTIGDRAVVGAGSVVTQDVPAGSLAAGNPASIRNRKI